MLQFIQRESPASRPRSNRMAAITILATFWVGFLNDLASIQGLQDKLWITLRTLLPQPDPASSGLEKKNENNLENGSIGQTATSAEDLQSAFSANQALLQLLSGFIDARSSNSSSAYKLVVQALLTWFSNTEMRSVTNLFHPISSSLLSHDFVRQETDSDALGKHSAINSSNAVEYFD